MNIDQIVSDFDHKQNNIDARFELNQILQAKKIPNALLFTGALNSGRKEAAFWFAKAINCRTMDHPGCGQCKSCRKIDAGVHPDIISTGPEPGKKAILISQIRQLATRIATKPNEALYRMVLIESSHLMNMQAQNAILKMLEEPPENTFFVLMTDKPAMLLSTIISRCRQIRFKPMSYRDCIDFICERTACDPKTAAIAAKTADRDVKKAILYLRPHKKDNVSGWLDNRKWLIKQLFGLMISGHGAVPRAQQGLMLSWLLCSEPQQLSDSLAVVKSFFRDLAICIYTPETIVNLDFFDQFKDISQKLPKGQAVKWLSSLFETEQKLMQNSSARLTLDSFFLSVVRPDRTKT